MEISDLLNRPAEQRLREFRYRAAQSLVFGLPVLALQWFGPRLGGPESVRWIAILQALLSGWIVYVAAAGMLFEGIILLRHKITLDLVISAAALLMYLYSVPAVIPVFFTGHLAYGPTLFHGSVLLLIAWCAWRWWRLHSTIDRAL